MWLPEMTSQDGFLAERSTGLCASRIGRGDLVVNADGDDHARWMHEALTLARTMQGLVWLNPAVGCIIVKDGIVVGRGRTQLGGRPHAERVALEAAMGRAQSATLYVTLEPCCHWGKTPPCTDAIIVAGVTTVYAALRDPDPRVNGEGFATLRRAGINVHAGLGAGPAAHIVGGFLKRIATGRPFVSVVPSTAESHSRVPSTYDGAAVTSEDGSTRLLLRMGNAFRETRLTAIRQPVQLLEYCGQIGLTALFVMDSDPLARRLCDASLVDSFSD